METPTRTAPIEFTDITAPLSPDDFLSRYWTREAVLLRVEERDFSPFCSWDGVNALLNAGDLTFPAFKVSRSDSPVSPELFTRKVGERQFVDSRTVVDLFREGASFGITGADSHWPPLRSIIECVHDALLESVHTNVYCSPAHTQGFQCHYDLHEVFVLQVAGGKRWRVFRPRVDAPIESWNRDGAEEALTTDPYIDVVLRAGDVLYVPRGHWHYAVAEASNSLHVTVGVTCRKGLDFMHWLTEELSQSSIWRRNAPFIGDGTEAERQSLRKGTASWAADLRASLLERLSDPSLFDRFLQDTVRSIHPLYNVDVLTQGSTDSVKLESMVFERPMGRPFTVGSNSGSGVVVGVAGADIELDGISETAVTRIFESRAFTLDDVRSWDPAANVDEVSDLLTALVQSGLLMARRKSTDD